MNDSVHYAEQLVKDAMMMWRLYAVQYRTLIIKYKILATIRRQENIRDKNKQLRSRPRGYVFIPKTLLREYPDIEFLKILDEADTKGYLLDLSCREIEKLLAEINRFNKSYLKATLEGRARDFQEEIKQHDNKRSLYIIISPDSCRGSKHYGSRRAPLVTNDY